MVEMNQKKKLTITEQVAQDYNMDKVEKIFVDGMMFRNPSSQAPAFIKGDISINIEKLKEFCIKNAGYISEKGWINVTLKESQKGTMYFELNTWKPQKQVEEKSETTSPSEEFPNGLRPSDIPF